MHKIYWEQSNLNVYFSKIRCEETNHNLTLYRCFGLSNNDSFKTPEEYFLNCKRNFFVEDICNDRSSPNEGSQDKQGVQALQEHQEQSKDSQESHILQETQQTQDALDAQESPNEGNLQNVGDDGISVLSETVSNQLQGSPPEILDTRYITETEAKKTEKEKLVNNIFIFIHGAGGCAEQFGAMMRELSKDPRSVMYAVDLLGHRQSFDQELNRWEEYQAPKLRADIDFVFKYCCNEFEKLLTLLGESDFKLNIVSHSYGTGLVVRLLKDQIQMQHNSISFQVPIYMKHLKKVVLISTSNSPPSATKSFLWYLPTTFVEWIRPALSRVNDRLMYHSSTSDQIISYWKSIASNNSIGMMKSLLRQVEWHDENDSRFIGQYLTTCKFIVISGEVDPVTPPSQAQRISMSCNGKFTIIQDASHNVMVEKAETVLSVILED